jgi:MoaA/NifB/PqqE/SkfB family radical SAM enzyme
MSKLNAEQKMLKYAANVVSSEEASIVTLQLDLTDFCVCKCKGCEHWKWQTKTKLSTDVIKKNVLPFIKNSRSLQSIVFSGGEPLLHPDVEAIAMTIKNYGKNVGIITSGLGKTNLDFKVLSESCNWIRLSSDGFNSVSYAETRGVNLFDKWTDNLKTLVEFNKTTNCKTRINVTIHEYNYKKFTDNLYQFLTKEKLDIEVYFWLSRELIDIYRKSGKDSVSDLLLSEYTNRILLDLVKLKNSFEEYDGHNKRIDISNVTKHINGQNTIMYKSCFVPQLFLLVASDGNVFPCCYMYEPVFTMDKQQLQYVIGNINEQSIDEILHSDSYKLIVKEFRECEKKFIQCKFCDRFDHINEYLNKFNSGDDVVFL